MTSKEREVLFEFKAKDKTTRMLMSKALFEDSKKSAEKKGMSHQAFIRLSLEYFIQEHKSGKMRGFESSYEEIPKDQPLMLRISSELKDEASKVAEKHDVGYQRLIREAIERNL